MKAAIVLAPGNLVITEVPEPTYGEYEALVDILYCGICGGTDTKLLHGQFPGQKYPTILGHESVGRVIACGARVENLAVGDIVLRPAAVRPGQMLGEFYSNWGGFAERGVVADGQAIRDHTPRGETPNLPPFAAAQQLLPADFPLIDVPMFITFKETLSWMQALGICPSSTVLILGSGPVGLCFMRVAKLMGAAPVIITGRREDRLVFARAHGADVTINVATENLATRIKDITGGRGADFVVEAVGDTQLLAEAVRLVADGGQVAEYGVPPVKTATIDWHAAPGNWSLRFIRPREEAVHQQALDALRLGLVDLRAFVDHVLPLEEIGAAFDLLHSRQALKVVIQI